MASLVDHVSQAQLLKHVRALEGERHPYFSPKRLQAAQDYVLRHWRALGLACAFDEFSYMGERFVNLIARPPTNLALRTQQLPQEGSADRVREAKPLACGQVGGGARPRLIIGAHLDTVPGTPGADDNASGIAVLLEASRLMASLSSPGPVEFVAFTLEELAMVGSAHYADGLRRAKTPVLGMMSLEMVGFTETQGLQQYPWFLRGRYPAQGTYLGLAANGRSRELLKTVAAAMRTVPGLPVETLVVPGNGWVFPESRLSDHAPFWDRGYPALLLTDTAFLRNPHYHQPSDTVETLDLDFLTRVCQGVVATIEALTMRGKGADSRTR
jgi:hypothetical protein